MARKRNVTQRLAPLAGFVLLAVALVAVNVLAGFLPARVDVTDEGLYTLSQGSENILADLKAPITLKLYYSRSAGDIPVGFKTYSRKVIELLRQYEDESEGKVTLQVLDPKPDTDEELWATRYGLSPARLPNGTSLYFGLVALQEDREANVPFLDPRRERFLEYDISQAISRVTQKEQLGVAVLSSLPMGGAMMQAQGRGDWAVIGELKKSYDVQFLYPDNLVEIPDNVQFLLVVHPKDLPARASYAIDQFVLRGGRLMVFVDPNSRMDPAARNRYGEPTNSNLETLFAHWGIQYDPLEVVGDHKLATRVNTRDGVLDYPVWVSLDRDHLNEDVPITSELEEITLIDAGALSLKEGSDLTFKPLLTSSTQSAMVDFTTVRMLNPVKMIESIQPDGKSRVMGGLLTGTFITAFPDGVPPAPKPDEKAQQQGRKPEPPPEPTHPHLSKAQKDTSVIIVADADFMADQFAVQTVNFFGNAILQPINDNLNLVLNSTEFLMGSQDLIHIRSRGQFSRPFTRVEALQVKAAERFRAQEQRLSDRLEQVKQKLRELERAKGQAEGETLLSKQQMEALQQFRVEEQETRKQLREVRKLLREDIEQLGNVLLAVNLLAVPVLVALFGFVVIWRRSVRKGGER